MNACKLARRTILLLPLLAAACASHEEPQQDFPPLRYNYLTKLRLNVADIEIQDSWAPRGGAKQVAYLSPVQPVDALRQMAQDRLAASGSSGHAVFVIDNASLTQTGDRFDGNFAVHLDIVGADGISTGHAEAQVSRSRSGDDTESPGAVKAALYTLVSQMMSDMNVEFEYQVRHSLRPYLESTTPTAPTPAPVQEQSLPPPS